MRPVRIDVAGGWYHATSRGLNRQPIFLDDRDREHFLDLLTELPERFGIRLHAYVLMSNHYHLLTQTPRANLSGTMQWLNLSYSVWFNRRHRRLGPVFNRPFKGILIERDGAWALEVSRYVHLNPVRVKGLGLGKPERRQERAGLAVAPEPQVLASRLKALREERWSSYRAYAGYTAPPPWLTCRELWKRAKASGQSETAAYRGFVEEYLRQGATENLWDRVHAGMVLGSQAFIDRMRKRVRGDRREQPQLRQWERVVPLATVIGAMEGVKGEEWPAFRDRRGDPGRDLVLSSHVAAAG